MEPSVVIRHRAGLVVRLIDTLTGRDAVQNDFRFARNGENVFPMGRADGKLVFLNFPPEACMLSVKSAWFLPQEIELTEDILQARMPLIELHLVPSRTYAERWSCATIEGDWPGIEQIDAVRLSDVACLAQSYDEKRKILNLFNPHHLLLDRTYYAVVNPDVCRYEPIEIVESCSEQKFRLASPLEQPVGNYYPVARRTLGAIPRPDHYILRVSEDSSDRRWLVRWRSGGTDYYQTIDFALPDTVKLRSPPEGQTDQHPEQ